MNSHGPSEIILLVATLILKERTLIPIVGFRIGLRGGVNQYNENIYLFQHFNIHKHQFHKINQKYKIYVETLMRESHENYLSGIS